MDSLYEADAKTTTPNGALQVGKLELKADLGLHGHV